jgi:SagB-type dehydrogenase family enzyme
LLWAAQGVTNQRGFRTAPSAGALYPLELYVVAGRVDGLGAGVYHYLPGPGTGGHRLERVEAGATLAQLSEAALGQESVRDAAAAVVFSSVTSRTAAKYADRALRYTTLEAGHAAQNLLLQATALGLGAVPVGAFYDNEVRELIGADALPLYVIPVGNEREGR